MQLRHQYLATNTSRIGFGAGILQVRDGMNCRHDKILNNVFLQPTAFASKSLSSVQQCYSNIEHEALGILDGLEKLYHYCFAMKVCIITNHKPSI